MIRTAARVALLGVAPWGWGCGPGEQASGDGIPAPPEAAPSEERLADSRPEPGALGSVAAVPALGRSGPGGEPFEVSLRRPGVATPPHRQIGRRTFELALRPRPLTQYPCTSCHGEPFVPGERIEDAHQDIQPVHPAETGAACVTCHAPDRVDRLVLQSGETATLDEAYRLCAQCHYAPVDAWAAGAHGKRLDGWRGRRVVLGCADCHDPHRPSIDRRIPFRGPTLPPARRPER